LRQWLGAGLRARTGDGLRVPVLVTPGRIVLGRLGAGGHRRQATRLEKKSPKPVAMSMMPPPMDLNTSAADCGRYATKKMRKAMLPQVRTVLTIFANPLWVCDCKERSVSGERHRVNECRPGDSR